MNKNISKYIISKYKKVEDALKIIDRNGEKTCFIVDEKKRLSRKDRSLIAKSEEIKNTDFENKLPKKFNKNNEIDIKEVSK